MPEITPQEREKALAELERIDQTLLQMSQWLVDAGEERAAIMLEEAWKNVAAAAWLIQRDPARHAALTHRRPAELDGYRRPAELDGRHRPAELDGRHRSAGLDGR